MEMATSWPEGNTELFLSIDQNGVSNYVLGGGIWEDDIFPKTHKHYYGYEKWKHYYYSSEGSRRRFRNFPFVSLFCKSNS